MRILIICEHYWPHTDACAKRMRVMAEELISRNHEVIVVASKTSIPSNDVDLSEHPEAHYYDTFAMKQKTVLNRLRNNLSEMKNATSLALSFDRPDVVVCTTPPLLLTIGARKVAKRFKAKFVLDVRDIWPDVAYEMGSFSPGGLYGRVFERVAQKAYFAADLITTVSPTKQKHLAAKMKACQEKVKLAPNGLDLGFLSQIERKDIIEKYQLKVDNPCVYVGNLGLAQGLSTLLSIAEANPSDRFLLFGGGAEESLLRREISRLELSNVQLCGMVDSSGAFTLLKHAGCAYVALKNSRMTDSVPTKLYEALGCGCPVLLAAQGDSAAVVGECKLGLVVPPEDGSALVEAYRTLRQTDWTEDARQFSVEHICNNHSRQQSAKVFADLIEGLK